MQPVRAVVSDNAGEREGGEGRAQVGVCPAARALAQCTEPPPLPSLQGAVRDPRWVS